MKKLLLIGLLTLAPLAGCGSFLQSSTIQGAAVSASSTSVSQASDVKAAGDLYVLATHAATAYLESPQATKDVERKIVPVEAAAYDALNAARKADKAGNSPALAAGLALFNANYARLAALIPGLH